MTAAQPYAKQFPYLSYIYQLANSNISNYNGLQVSLTQRTQHGLSYVIGLYLVPCPRRIIGQLEFHPSDGPNGNQKSLYSSTSFDVRHHFTASVTYALPGCQEDQEPTPGRMVAELDPVDCRAARRGVSTTRTDFSGTNEINAGPHRRRAVEFLR